MEAISCKIFTFFISYHLFKCIIPYFSRGFKCFPTSRISITPKACISSATCCGISSSRRKMHAGAWWDTNTADCSLPYLMICTTLRAVMIYQAYGNPQSSSSSLRGTPTAAWINKKGTFVYQKFLFCWRRQRDSNPRGVAPKRFSRTSQSFPTRPE